jgi:hypothetical protein
MCCSTAYHREEASDDGTVISAAGDCRLVLLFGRGAIDLATTHHPVPVRLAHARPFLLPRAKRAGGAVQCGWGPVESRLFCRPAINPSSVKGAQGLSVTVAQRTNAGAWKSSCQRAAGRRSLSFVNWSRFDTREATEEDVKAFRETPFAKSFLALFDHIVKERLKGPTQSPSIRIKEQVDLDASSTNNAVGGARSVGRSRWGPARPSRPIRWQWNHQPADQKLFSSPI